MPQYVVLLGNIWNRACGCACVISSH